MKKVLLLSLLLAGTFTVFPVSSANAAETSAAVAAAKPEPQWQRRNRGQRNRTYIQTTTVRRGRYLYRETYRVRVKNGVVVSRKLISRTRITR